MVPSPTAGIAFHVSETVSTDNYVVGGWGKIHLVVLIFESGVKPPFAIDKTDEETGKKEDPFKMVEVRMPKGYLSTKWKREQQDMGLDDNRDSMAVIKYLIPLRDAGVAVGDSQRHPGHGYCSLRV